METTSRIEDFNFVSGLIEIGNHKIFFDTEDISIQIDIKGLFNDTLWGNYVYVKNEVEYISKFNDQNVIEKIYDHSIIQYIFNFKKQKITGDEINYVIEEYKRGNRKTK